MDFRRNIPPYRSSVPALFTGGPIHFRDEPVNYPNEREITDPATGLPPKVAADLVPLVESAQRRYRRFRQSSVEYGHEPQIVIDHATEVFKTLAILQLRSRSGSFEDFRSEVCMDSGAADTAFRYAHYLYKSVQGGRMLATWHWQVRDRLRGLIREAEDLWWNPDVVPLGWEDFINGGGSGHQVAPADRAVQNPLSAIDRSESILAGAPDAGSPDAASGQAVPAAQGDSPLTSGQARRVMVDAFIERCLYETGVKVTRTMIWRAVGYKQRSEFERWESNSPKATRKSAQSFARILSTRPRDFIDLLRRRQLPH